MIKHTMVLNTVVLAVTLIGGVMAGEKDLPQEMRADLAKAVPPGTVTDVEVFETNGFRVESSSNNELGGDLKPTGEQFQFLSVTADGVFNVGVEKGRSMSSGGGVAIFHRDSGSPILSVGDQSGDGRIDILEYTVVDEQGQEVLTVIDYEADGQADLRVHAKEGYFEIWHQDRWRRTEQRDDRRGINLEGEFIELERRDNRWIVP